MRFISLLALCTWLGLVAIRLTGPDDLMARDQERVASYVQDITQNGHWMVQQDLWGNIASKPPLYNWLAGLATEFCGDLTRFSYAFPSWMATGITVLLLLAWGGRLFGPWAGFWAVPLYLFSQLGLRQVLLVRSDAVFQCLTFAASLAAFRAWQTSRGWTWFYLLAAGATMTKSPLGLILAATGLLAAVWESRQGTPLPLRGRHRYGILLFLAIPLLWLLLAWWHQGDRVIDKLIHQELLGHAFGGEDQGKALFSRFYNPSLWFLSRMFPLCIFAIPAMVRVFRIKDEVDERRRFARFLTCAFLSGLLLFSSASHKRFVHLLPLIPLAALLGGWHVARITGTLPDQKKIFTEWPHRDPDARNRRLALIVCGAGLTLAWIYLHLLDRNSARTRPSWQTRAFASELEARTGPDFPWIYVDAPPALQTHLKQFGEALPAQQAAALFDPEWPAFFAVMNREPFIQAVRGFSSNEVHEVASGPETDPFLFILSPHAKLEWPEQWQGRVQGVQVFARNLIMERRQGSHWRFRTRGGDWTLQFSYELDADQLHDTAFPTRVDIRSDQGLQTYHVEPMQQLSGNAGPAVPRPQKLIITLRTLLFAGLAGTGLLWGLRRVETFVAV